MALTYTMNKQRFQFDLTLSSVKIIKISQVKHVHLIKETNHKKL